VILGDCVFHTAFAKQDGKDLQRFAAILGLDAVDTIDLFGSPTVRHDLHQPVPADMAGTYDLVVDAGTMFCCFDVIAVWRNIVRLLAVDGVVAHLAGLTGYFGRSFYSLHPALFKDFYAVNGFEIVRLATRAARDHAGFHPVDREATFLVESGPDGMRWSSEHAEAPGSIPTDTVVVCAARRRDVVDFTIPAPSYYASGPAQMGRLSAPARPPRTARLRAALGR
jgi:hypothetical protein